MSVIPAAPDRPGPISGNAGPRSEETAVSISSGNTLPAKEDGEVRGAAAQNGFSAVSFSHVPPCSASSVGPTSDSSADLLTASATDSSVVPPEDPSAAALPATSDIACFSPVHKRHKPIVHPPAQKSGSLLIRIAPADVGLFRFLLEGYDNLALFTVLDRRAALLKLLFSPHQEKDVRAALEAMRSCVHFALQEWPLKKLGS